jgi:hypothetical protein
MKFSSRQKMKVEMKNRLSRPGIIVVDNPEAVVRHSLLPCNAGGHLEDVTHHRRILLPKIQRIHGVLPGYYQQMQRGDRGYIFYDNKMFILVYLPGRYLTSDNLAEYAIFHTIISSSFSLKSEVADAADSTGARAATESEIALEGRRSQ